MEPLWNVYLSFGVIIIFSNARVFSAQTEHATTRGDTSSLQQTTIDKKNVSLTNCTSSLTPSPITSTSSSASKNFSFQQNEITSLAQGRIVANGRVSTTSSPSPSSSSSSSTLPLSSTRDEENYLSSKEIFYSTVPVSQSQDAQSTYAPTTRPPFVVTKNSFVEENIDKKGNIKTIMKPTNSNPESREPTTTDSSVTESWATTESFSNDDPPVRLSTANLLPAHSELGKKFNDATTSPLDLTEYAQTTFLSPKSTEYSSNVKSTVTLTTFQTTNAPKLNIKYKAVTSTTSYVSGSSGSVRYPSTSVPFSASNTTASGLNVTSSLVTADATLSSYLNTNSLNVTTNDKHSFNKEHLQFPGITLKVSHVLIPKQKRSRYNIQNMRIELPRTEMLSRSPSSVAKTSKKSNCTRFPVQVVAAADTDSKEKVNLTEEHYDCEFSSEIQSTQKKDPVDSVHTYYGGYVFRYTIPKQMANSSTTNQTSTESTRATETTTVDENDDYDTSYVEYSDATNNSNNTGVVDDGVFPDPVMRNEKMVEQVKLESYNVPISDNSMMDSDLHDHDVIDSVMYIYFGGTTHGQRGAGRQIIIVGAVIALVAQFLTLASSLRRIKTHKGEEPTVILLNIETALTLTNLIFILGVQSTSDHAVCKVTAVALYYLHLAILIWFLLSSMYSVQIVCQIKPPCTFLMYCFCGWLLPLLLTTLGYVLNERSFETSLYCWVSPLKGILFSFILPVILISLMCMVLTIYGLKRVTEPQEEVDDTYSHRKLLRIAAVSLPLFSVIWFTGMVALENSSSLLCSLIFLISDTVLNWLLFACWLPSEASQWKDMDDDYYDEEEDFDDEPVLAKRRFDDQPLLSELYEYGAQGQLYNMKVEPISIISTP